MKTVFVSIIMSNKKNSKYIYFLDRKPKVVLLMSNHNYFLIKTLKMCTFKYLIINLYQLFVHLPT